MTSADMEWERWEIGWRMMNDNNQRKKWSAGVKEHFCRHNREVENVSFKLYKTKTKSNHSCYSLTLMVST